MTKRCPRCGETKPLTLEHWHHQAKDPETGEVLRYAGWCRPCHNAYQRERRGSRTEEQREARRIYLRGQYALDVKTQGWRERHNARKRIWRNTAGSASRRAAQKRWYAKLKADPVRYAAYLENRRIADRLRKERKGRPVERSTSTAVNAWQLRKERKPLEPFLLWLNEVIATDHRDLDELCRAIDVSERRVYDYRERIAQHVSLPSAERAVWHYGRPVRISPRRVEAELKRLETIWRDAPGNGARLGGYLHDAELLAPLAGAVIVTAEDLWVTV